MKKLILLILMIILPLMAFGEEIDCKDELVIFTLEDRNAFYELSEEDREFCKNQKEESRESKETKEGIKKIIGFLIFALAEVNESKIPEELAVFTFRFYNELIRAGFTEEQSMRLLSLSGNILYEHTK